jgi:4-hydroxy-3-methylbut-2-enyl diphosphate reductase IspH
MMVYSLRQGKAEAIEVIVHGDQQHSDVIGKSITFPEYTIDEIKQLQSSDNVLSAILNFVEQR